MRIIFVTTVGNFIGYGHLNRCLSLAAHASKSGMSVFFLLFGDSNGPQIVRDQGYPYAYHQTLNENNINLVETVNNGQEFDAVVIDIIHSHFFSETENWEAVLKKIGSLGEIVTIIDSLGNLSLAENLPDNSDVKLHLLVVPYVSPFSEHRCLRNSQWRLLIGPEFTVLDPSFSERPSFRKIEKKAQKILVTCGGSDLKQLTPRVLQGLERVTPILEVLVIIGPFFLESLRKEIQKCCEKSKHEISICVEPSTSILFQKMLWSDIAISSSGLSKYELAATGTPAVLFSIDEIHHQNNLHFSKLGSVIDLGTDPSPDTIGDVVGGLLNDFELRTRLSEAGLRLVDGNGALRLLSEIRHMTTNYG